MSSNDATSTSVAPSAADDDHCRYILQAIANGIVVPFFGAGVNLCGRPSPPNLSSPWNPDGNFLPSGAELAEFLARKYTYRGQDPWNLLRVAQHVDVDKGSGPLYLELRAIFNRDFPPTPLHRFFATLPQKLAKLGCRVEQQPLFVTTNYDDLMERAFEDAGQDFDLVSYVADGEDAGKFVHWPPHGDGEPIKRPKRYVGRFAPDRPVVLKIHGAIHRKNSEHDSFAITEDHYIDYLTRTDVSALVPVELVERLKHSHFLFLGYSLSDWNLRVILRRIWQDQKLSFHSWSVQFQPTPNEVKAWAKRDVEVFSLDLADYIAALSRQLGSFAPPGGLP